MFGHKGIHDEYEKVIDEIRDGERRDPQHDVPDDLRGKWNPAEVDPVDQHVFDEFAWFGATLDWSIGDAWSFEETSDTMLRAWYLESPDYGRRWTIYYNALKLGWLEASANPKKLFGTVDEFYADPVARVDMHLDMMRFIPSGAAFELLYQASFLMQSVEGGYDAARERARLTAESAMTRYMWKVMQASDQYVPALFFSAEGPYAIFREMVAHWREVGYDPFTRNRSAGSKTEAQTTAEASEALRRRP